MDTMDPASRSRLMARIRSKHTGPERAFARELRRLRASGWRRHRRIEGVELDFCFRRARLGVRIHGCFWHMHDCGRCRIPSTRRSFWRRKLERNAERDAEQLRKLRRAGWRILTVWECQPLRRGAERALALFRA